MNGNEVSVGVGDRVVRWIAHEQAIVKLLVLDPFWFHVWFDQRIVAELGFEFGYLASEVFVLVVLLQHPLLHVSEFFLHCRLFSNAIYGVVRHESSAACVALGRMLWGWRRVV